MERNEGFYNRVGGERIASRQIDELIGLARGVCADDTINQAEAEFLEKWLAASGSMNGQPVIDTLYARISEMLVDGQLDSDERVTLFETLNEFANGDFELGELLKSTSPPLCRPAPDMHFVGRRFTFTGTFSFGQRRECERAVLSRGASAGSLTRETSYLVVGVYATESWKHSSFGNKVMKACEMRDAGVPISIVSEDHWASSLS